jgi:hypothetical protein
MDIRFRSDDFRAPFSVPGWGYLGASWDDVLWAALTIGRPSTYHVLQHGQASLHEAMFRLSLVRMALSEDGCGNFAKTSAFAALDPTEKGMVSYFLGMTFTKLFASRYLHTPWLLHLDVFKDTLNPSVLGRSRPDLVGQSAAGEWFAFESKGRSAQPSATDRANAKAQAQRLVAIGGVATTLHVGSFAYFRHNTLEYYWRDPMPDSEDPLRLPAPGRRWRHYYECALALAESTEEGAWETATRERADIEVQLHPKIRHFLLQGLFEEARLFAINNRDLLEEEGYKRDGVRVSSGDDWRQVRIEG